MAKILVIDDDLSVCQYLATVLEAAGHTVLTADNGAKGVEILKRNPADLVLCDLFMPIQEGLQTIKEINQLFKTMPIIAISGGSPSYGDFLSMAVKLGAVEALPKPLAPDTLYKAIETHLAG